MRRVHPVEALQRLGGVADRQTLLCATTISSLRGALARGEIVKAGHRGFALPSAQRGLRAAQQLSGVASHESAASYHGWEIKSEPERPNVIVPRKRNVPFRARRGVQVRYRDLDEHEHGGLVTGKARTVIDCARDLPFDRALSVADSALRHEDVIQDELVELALALPNRGRARALRVIEAADGRAANPFESCLRAIALDVPGLCVEPQLVIEQDGFRGRPDLVDVTLRIVIEADSYEFHSSRADLHRDIRRYTALVVRGWTVVRFTWEDVMFDPDYVRACLVSLVEGAKEQAVARKGAQKPA
ncbi:MAG: DUF559 domain-containing protein [Nocardioidaceae bacterium]